MITIHRHPRLLAAVLLLVIAGRASVVQADPAPASTAPDADATPPPTAAPAAATTTPATNAPAAPKDEQPNAVAKTVVTGIAAPETAPTADTAAAALATIPGTVSLVTSAEVDTGKASNAEDVLAFQPGVFAQATSGNVANKISIRGSGLNTFYQGYVLGVKILYDGLSVTGPGGTQEDLLDIAAVNYTEILNGDNAYQYASTSLGGAINFVTNTGYTSPGYYGRFEFGSFGYNKQELSVGGVDGTSDYYVAVLHDERQGYQQTTPNSGEDIIANFGHKFNKHLESRLIVRYRQDKLVEGSALTKEQIAQDPTLNTAPVGRKEPGTTVVGSKTTYTFDDGSQLYFGANVHNYPLYNGWRYSTTPQWWTSEDVNGVLSYKRDDDLFGSIHSTTEVIASDVRLVNGYVQGYNGQDGTVQTLRQFTKYTGSQDAVYGFGNELELINNKLWLSDGISEIGIDRDVRIKQTVLPNGTQYPLSVDYNKWYPAPHAGLRFQVVPGVELYSNVGVAVDGPITWQMGSTGLGYVKPLQPQTGTTGEVGVRVTEGIFEGSLDFYRSWIKNELLTIVVIPATPTTLAVTATSNSTPTDHQGVEGTLAANFWKNAAGDKIFLRQTFNLNDFHYRDDPVFGQNELPGLPTEVYQAELRYQQKQGIYAGINLRAASSYYVDFANTLKAPGYGILGAKLGYQTPHWEWFLDLRNIANKHYVSATNTAYNLQGVDSANFFPGDGFDVISGISFHF
jgi:iron complex outermembrane receptor protein